MKIMDNNKGLKFKLGAIATFLTSFTAPSLSSLAPIVTHNEFLYNSETRERFTCRGVTVSPVSVNKPMTNWVDHFIDSLEYEWMPIIDSLKDLNANCIRIYQVCNMNDPEIIHPNKSAEISSPECGSHEKFMNALAEAGIYVVVPAISAPPFYANTLRADLPAPECYAGKRGRALFKTAAARVSEFAKYNNTLAFNVGNELVLYGPEEARPAFTGVFGYPCVKALARDLKKHMVGSQLRKVPTIYAMQDSAGGPESMQPQGRYLSCSFTEDPDETVDIIGYNTYTWCGRNQTYDTVYRRYVDELLPEMNIPVVLSEYGCTGGKDDINDPNRFVSQYPWTKNYRNWEQVSHIFNSSEMGRRFSGAFAYELIMYAEMKKYQQKGKRISESYGLIATRAAGNVEKDDPDFKKLPTYYALAEQYEQVKETKHYTKGEWTVPGRVSAMSCGKPLNETEIKTWLRNYFLVDRATNEKSKWWDDDAVNYLATGTMPETQYRESHPYFAVYVIVIPLTIISLMICMHRTGYANFLLQRNTTRMECITLYDYDDYKKQEKDDITKSSYGSLGSFYDIEKM